MHFLVKLEHTNLEFDFSRKRRQNCMIFWGVDFIILVCEKNIFFLFPVTQMSVKALALISGGKVLPQPQKTAS